MLDRVANPEPSVAHEEEELTTFFYLVQELKENTKEMRRLHELDDPSDEENELLHRYMKKCSRLRLAVCAYQTRSPRDLWQHFDAICFVMGGVDGFQEEMVSEIKNGSSCVTTMAYSFLSDMMRLRPELTSMAEAQ